MTVVMGKSGWIALPTDPRADLSIGRQYTTSPVRFSVSAQGEMFVAVVSAADGVRFVAAGWTRDGVFERLADYVKARLEFELSISAKRRIRALLARGALERGVQAYFESRAHRWDEEWLHVATTVVERDAPASIRMAR
jgi:hypothetical protein